MDINTKILKKNAFRVTKERGMTASRIRVPGGHLDAKYLSQIQHIAETFGNGTVHITADRDLRFLVFLLKRCQRLMLPFKA